MIHVYIGTHHNYVLDTYLFFFQLKFETSFNVSNNHFGQFLASNRMCRRRDINSKKIVLYNSVAEYFVLEYVVVYKYLALVDFLVGQVIQFLKKKENLN